MLIQSSRASTPRLLPTPSAPPTPDAPPRLLGGGERPPPPGRVVLADGVPEALFAFAAGLSAFVYRELAWGVDVALEKEGARHVRVFERGSQQAIGCVLDGRAWLAFRGTSELADWGVNLMAVPFYHAGFRRAWRALRPGIAAWLEGVRGEARTLVLTGHSLGGALANVAARDLAGAALPIEAVVTFGAPRAGAPRWARQYEATPVQPFEGAPPQTLGRVSWRIANEADVVPRVPPAVLGFKHVGQPLELGGLARRGLGGGWAPPPAGPSAFLPPATVLPAFSPSATAPPVFPPSATAPPLFPPSATVPLPAPIALPPPAPFQPVSLKSTFRPPGEAPARKLRRAFDRAREINRSSVGASPIALYIDALVWASRRPAEHMMAHYGLPFGSRLAFCDALATARLPRLPGWERVLGGLLVVALTALVAWGGYRALVWSGEWGVYALVMLAVWTALSYAE